uniref:Uncharacterized protein n=1 Tax=Anguilla anguilla TaxID=7936 RepID=A0A0E9P7Q9_ANGAN
MVLPARLPSRYALPILRCSKS